jgi:hypothetical protein
MGNKTSPHLLAICCLGFIRGLTISSIGIGGVHVEHCFATPFRLGEPIRVAGRLFGFRAPKSPRRLPSRCQNRRRDEKTQRLLERTGRLYKEDCWRPLITGVPFDQSPSAYLYPEHAPERPPIVGRVEEPKWNYQRLLADQPAHNARLGSYWSLGVASDGTVGLSKIIRSIGSLNIKTIEARNHMIANLEHDFSPRDEAKVA